MNESLHQLDESDKKSFAVLTNVPVPKVSERDFIRFFLPLFKDKSGETDVDVGKWLDVAGHAHAPVDIVDTAGKVIFRVPPLLQDVNINNYPGGREHSIYEVVKVARQKATIHPRMGIQHLEQGLENRLGGYAKTLDTINQFNSIFERYGVEKIAMPKEVVKDDSKSKPSSEEITDFEDF